MPKLKTSRAAAKRFKITKAGKAKKRRAYAGHILTKKSRKRKRQLRKSGVLGGAERKLIKKVLPYA